MSDQAFALHKSQTLRCLFNLNQWVEGQDQADGVVATVSPDDGGCAVTAELLSADEAEVEATLSVGTGVYDVSVQITTDARRSVRYCYRIYALETPPLEPLRFDMRPGELVAYRLNYSQRLRSGEKTVTVEVSQDQMHYHFAAAVAPGGEVVAALSLDAACGCPKHEATLTVTTDQGRVWVDTFLVIPETSCG